MGVSNPIIQIFVNNIQLSLREWTSVTVEQPEGAGSQICTIGLAPGISISAVSSLLLKMGYGNEANLVTMMDTDRLARSDYTIEPRRDSITATWQSKLDKYRRRAPLVPEFWKGRNKGLYDLLLYVGVQKLGYVNVVTNLPNYSMPDKIEFRPEESYWAKLNKIIDPWKALWLPDDISGWLYIYSMDIGILGSFATMPIARAETIPSPKETSAIYTTAILRYFAPPDDGGPIVFDCADPESEFTDETGVYVKSTTAGCDVEFDPTAHASLLSRTTYDPDPATTADGTKTKTRRTTIFAQVLDDEDKPVGEPIPLEERVTTYLTDGVITGRPVHRKTTHFKWVRGTSYRYSAGHRSTTEAYMFVPLAGEIWVSDLYSEVETIVYLVTETGDFTKWQSVKQAAGRVLYPENVPLYEANANRAIDQSAAPYQYVSHTAIPLFQQTETLIQTGASTHYARALTNYLTRKTELPGDQGDAAGFIPTAKEAELKPTEEYYTDGQYKDDLGNFAEPIDNGGWQEAITIDATWIGPDPIFIIDGGGATITPRDWAVALANVVFRRSGKRRTTWNPTFFKFLGWLRRGSLVWSVRRGQTNKHKAVVTAVRWRAEKDADGQPIFRTSIQARRLENVPTADA